MRNKTKYTEKSIFVVGIGDCSVVATAMSARSQQAHFRCRQGGQRAALSHIVGRMHSFFLHCAETNGSLAMNHTLNESPYN
jgi:hypothetical protein